MRCLRVSSVSRDCGASCAIHRNRYVGTVTVFRLSMIKPAIHIRLWPLRLPRGYSMMVASVPGGTTSQVCDSCPSRTLHRGGDAHRIHSLMSFQGYSHRTHMAIIHILLQPAASASSFSITCKQMFSGKVSLCVFAICDLVALNTYIG